MDEVEIVFGEVVEGPVAGKPQEEDCRCVGDFLELGYALVFVGV